MPDINSDKEPKKITKYDTSHKKKEILHPIIGAITLRLFLSFKDVKNITKYNNTSDTIDFCKKFLYTHFIDPPFNYKEVDALSEDDLKELVITYTRYYCSQNQGETLFDDISSLENFETNIIEYSQKIIDDFDSASLILSKISVPSNIDEISKYISSLSNIFDPLNFFPSDLLKGIQGIHNISSICGLPDYSDIIPDVLSKTCLNSVSSALSDIQFPIYDSLQTVIDSLIQQSLPSLYDISSIIPSDLIQCSISPLSTIFTTPQINLYESIPSFFDIADISKYFPTISEISNSWLKELNRSIDSIRALSEQVLISHNESEEILIKYKWLISPSFPFDFNYAILEIYQNQTISPRDKYHTINQIFREYLTGKNCKELTHLVNMSTVCPIIKKRKKILMDCLWAIKHKNSGFNPSNLVTPVLISQIDGILYDFFIHMNWKPDRTQWIDITNTYSGKKNQTETFTCIVTKQQAIFQSAFHLLVNVLLQSALPNQSKEELSIPHIFSRHKILHGQFTTYGRLDNALRCFLIIDFLSYLYENSDQL